MVSSGVLHRLRHWPPAGGVLLGLAALAGMVLANGALQGHYETFLSAPAYVGVGGLGLSKPLLLWINDGLMAVFFFLVGLEIKRELLEGQLASWRAASLPAFAALGGMIVPAIVFLAVNAGVEANLRGWAIPAATDIAFALGVLTVLGPAVPVAGKVFLTAVAVIDDLGAICIIALFYSEGLSTGALAVVTICVGVLTLLNLKGVLRLTPYLLVGAVMWVAVLKSGVHATLAGVLLALFVPLRVGPGLKSPVHLAEKRLHGWVAFAILPLFAFANAGVDLQDVTWSAFAEPLTLGIAAGLLLGKPIGILAAVGLALLSGLSRLPRELDWWQMAGIAVLCGIGFTMSLFIGGLAFEGPEFAVRVRLGVLAGSLCAALLGLAVLALAARRLRWQAT